MLQELRRPANRLGRLLSWSEAHCVRLQLCSTRSCTVTLRDRVSLPRRLSVPAAGTLFVASLNPVSRVTFLCVRGMGERLYYASFSARSGVWCPLKSLSQPRPSSLLGVLEHLMSSSPLLEQNQRPQETPNEIFGAFLYNANSNLTLGLVIQAALASMMFPSDTCQLDSFTAFLVLRVYMAA